MEEIIQHKLKAIPYGKVLDVATGKGHALAWLMENLRKRDSVHTSTLGIGIDRDKRMIKKASVDPATMADGEKALFLTMDAANIGFHDASFDIVAIVNSLHHLTDPHHVLTEMKRVLKPAGYLIIGEMYRDVHTPAQRSHVDLHHWWATIDTGRGIPHHQTFTRQAILDLTQGLELKDLSSYDVTDTDQDPFDEDLHTELNLAINLYLQRAKALPTYDQLAQHAEALRERLKNVGLQWAPQLLILGQK